jgi:hypothetical protein
MERQPGEALRLIDVPAVFDGADHIFDRVPANEADNEVWKNRAFAAIAKACERNHGKPFRKYIKTLIAKGATLKDEVESNVNSFVESACDKFDGAIARDVTRKWGLIYTGGLFGIQCRLLPWTEAELRDAVLKSLAAARELLPDKGVLLRSGMATLKTKRRQLPRISMPIKGADATRDYEPLDGYRYSTDSEIHYRIKVEVYKKIFTSGEQRELVTNWLIERNRITLATPHKATNNVSRKPQDQFIWPDDKRRRSIEIVWPLKEKPKKRKGKAK